MAEWPTLAVGVLFVLGAGWMLVVQPEQYRQVRRQPKWLLPISRLWPERLDTMITKILAALLAAWGVVLIVWALLAG